MIKSLVHSRQKIIVPECRQCSSKYRVFVVANKLLSLLLNIIYWYYCMVLYSLCNKLLLFNITHCYSNTNSNTKNIWSEMFPFNRVRWQLIADRNEWPNRIQEFVAFFQIEIIEK